MIHPIAGLPDLETQIEVFSIHEVMAAKSADAIECLSFYQNARARNGLGLGRLGGMQRLSAPDAPAGKDSAKEFGVEHLIQHRGKSLNTTCLQRTITVYKP